MTTVVSQDLLPVVVRQDTAVVVTRESGETVVVRQSAAPAVVVTRGIPGPPGPPGDPSGALLIGNRLSEFDTPAAREQAQANLGLGVVDPLAYYILAKA